MKASRNYNSCTSYSEEKKKTKLHFPTGLQPNSKILDFPKLYVNK